jgi:hypothetical protein
LIAALLCAAPAAHASDDFAFAPAVGIALPPGDPWKLRAVDVTGDGLIDLVVVDVMGRISAPAGASLSNAVRALQP